MVARYLRRNWAYIVFLAAVGVTGCLVQNAYYFQVLTFIGINTLLALGAQSADGLHQPDFPRACRILPASVPSPTAILTATWGPSPGLALPCALAIAALVALVVGLPTLKLSGYYLGMGTLGFGMIVHIFLREWTEVTGGLGLSASRR